jgi:hypothetical protein
MECNQKENMVAATKTLYENFLEEKCENDFLIPDYYPAAEKIIQCSAVPTVSKKEIEGDRLILEGNCKFVVIYQGEDDCGIKSLSETVSFCEDLPLKELGDAPMVNAVVRISGASCRLLNPRKINAKATVSIAVKVKNQQYMEIIESISCDEAEALFLPKRVYTVLESVAETTKVQGEIVVHTGIQDILKTCGVVCVKDVKVMSGKAMVKGVVDLFILFTTEEDPCAVEQTSTAIPFMQLIPIGESSDDAEMEVVSSIQTIRADVEADDDGKNKVISISVTLMTEGELYLNQEHRFLMDAYSNRYHTQTKNGTVSTEELVERCEFSRELKYEIPLDGEDAQIIQAIGVPTVKKISGQDDSLLIDGVLDVSLFIKEGDGYRSAEKSFNFTLKKEVEWLCGQMRCEIHPSLLVLEGGGSGSNAVLRAEIHCEIAAFSKQTTEVISEFSIDVDHPLEKSTQTPLIVYYGEKGERLWDIARKYATSVAGIKSVNGIETDILDKKQLLLIAR